MTQRGLSFAMALVVAGTAKGAAQESDFASRVDSVFSQYDNTRSPGCALGVMQDGDLVLARGYGMANLEHGIALSPTSVFRIGSTSKQFTAAAVVLLEQEGKLSLEDEIQRHLPEIQSYERPVTIRHLLNHTSGVRDYLTLMAVAGKRDEDWYTDDDVLAMVARQRELNFLPGDEYLYSNSGYFLLSQIVKRVSGESLREYAEQRIFEPLGMTHTHFHDDHTEVVPDRAMGYAPVDHGVFNISMTTLDMVGDGGVFTSVEDLVNWDRNFYEPKVGGTPFLDAMHTRAILTSGDTLGYALGLGIGEYRGLETVSHGGAFVGFRADIIRFPTEQFTVICLCNVSTANPTRLARQVADIHLEDRLEAREASPDRTRQERDQPSEPRLPTAAEQRLYAGDYYSEELDVVYRILAEGDSLMLHLGNFFDGSVRVQEGAILRRGPLTFRFQVRGDATTGFLLDAGRVKNLRFVRR
jgi:CubicO group peptidase (beta-lactamase class C family)